MTLSTEIKPDTRDGRTQRRMRNRERVADALFTLVREGYCRPTADQVAARAGVGRRTVFRHFDDLESLFAEVATQVRDQARTRRVPVDRQQPVQERVREMVSRRALLFEELAPFRRANTAHLWRSPVLQKFEVENNLELRKDLQHVIPELQSSSSVSAHGVEMLAGPETWDRLRDVQLLSSTEAETTVGYLILQLLGEK